MSLSLSLVLVMGLFGSCSPQDTQDIILLTLNSVVQKIEGLENKMTSMEESIKTLEERTDQSIKTLEERIIGHCQTDVNKTTEVLLDAINTGMGNLPDTTQMMSEFLEQNQSLCRRNPIGSNCKELLDDGYIKSGVYTITPEGFPDGVEVYCDQETDGGGWTVFLQRQRQSQQVNFARTFKDYAAGFGDPNGEIWIGNSVLHSMTGDKPFTLRVDATNLQGELRTGIWNTFSVGSQDTEFTLSVAGYSSSSTLGDGISRTGYHGANGMKFSTYDRDNDKFAGDCSRDYRGDGGWWYNWCGGANPTAPLGNENDNNKIVNWYYWETNSSSGRHTALSDIYFKIRP